MCLNCWKEAGSPKIDNPLVRALVDAVDAVYKERSSGGRLHIQLDDWNLDDDYCTPDAFAQNYQRLYDWEPTDAERFALRCLVACTEAERYSALYFAWQDPENAY